MKKLCLPLMANRFLRIASRSLILACAFACSPDPAASTKKEEVHELVVAKSRMLAEARALLDPASVGGRLYRGGNSTEASLNSNSYCDRTGEWLGEGSDYASRLLKVMRRFNGEHPGVFLGGIGSICSRQAINTVLNPRDADKYPQSFTSLIWLEDDRHFKEALTTERHSRPGVIVRARRAEKCLVVLRTNNAFRIYSVSVTVVSPTPEAALKSPLARACIVRGILMGAGMLGAWDFVRPNGDRLGYPMREELSEVANLVASSDIKPGMTLAQAMEIISTRKDLDQSVKQYIDSSKPVDNRIPEVSWSRSQ